MKKVNIYLMISIFKRFAYFLARLAIVVMNHLKDFFFLFFPTFNLNRFIFQYVFFFFNPFSIINSISHNNLALILFIYIVFHTIIKWNINVIYSNGILMSYILKNNHFNINSNYKLLSKWNRIQLLSDWTQFIKISKKLLIGKQ